MKKSVLSTIFVIAALPLFADPRFLLESESPYLLEHLSLEGRTTIDYESGAIPTSILKPEFSIGLFDWLQVKVNTTLAYFFDTQDFRLAEAAIMAKAGIPQRSFDESSLFFYIGAHGTFGEPYTQVYEGELPTVYTVVSQHGDTGLDITAGVTGSLMLAGIDPRIGLFFSADYSRTGLRTYNPAFGEEAYKNRINLNLAPSILPGEAGSNDRSVAFAVQNRLTYWFSRGFMYDVIPQATLLFESGFALTAGVSIPAIGGRVFKALVTGRYQVALGNPKDIRIRVTGLHFPPDSAVLFGPANEKSEENRNIIEKLYRRISRYPDYHILVEGHTSLVNWDDPDKAAREDREECIPLSNARARVVLETLVELGFPREQIDSIGKGASEPLVPFSNPDIQWKNRRVELYLYKEQ